MSQSKAATITSRIVFPKSSQIKDVSAVLTATFSLFCLRPIPNRTTSYFTVFQPKICNWEHQASESEFNKNIFGGFSIFVLRIQKLNRFLIIWLNTIFVGAIKSVSGFYPTKVSILEKIFNAFHFSGPQESNSDNKPLGRNGKKIIQIHTLFQ